MAVIVSLNFKDIILLFSSFDFLGMFEVSSVIAAPSVLPFEMLLASWFFVCHKVLLLCVLVWDSLSVSCMRFTGLSNSQVCILLHAEISSVISSLNIASSPFSQLSFPLIWNSSSTFIRIFYHNLSSYFSSLSLTLSLLSSSPPSSTGL